MASSTTKPDAMVRAISDRLSSPKPAAAIIAKVAISDSGSATAGMIVLLTTTASGVRTRRRDRTLLYRIVDAVGRWSMIDVFMMSILAALVQFGAVVTIIPGPGAIAFAAVVILTMLAAMAFDPRLIWDHAANPRPNRHHE
jgi:paraquat-inducible protein A